MHGLDCGQFKIFKLPSHRQNLVQTTNKIKQKIKNIPKIKMVFHESIKIYVCNSIKYEKGHFFYI